MRIGRISLPRVRLSAEYRESTKFSVNYAEFACLSWSQNELREICVIRALARYTPCLKEGRENGANCAEFTWLYLTQNELCETRVICCSLGSLPGPEKVPLFGADCTKSASLADVVGEWREICSVRKQFPLFVYKRLTKTTVSLK